MNLKKVLITDIDNTLFDWFDMWHVSFTFLIEALERETGLERPVLLAEAKRCHELNGTSEYHFLLDDMPSAKSLPNSVREEIRDAYVTKRNELLIVYPGVYETLLELKRRGAVVVAFSESKKYYSEYRIVKLGLSDVIDCLYCPADHSLHHHKEDYESFDLQKIIELPDEFKKPNPDILSKIITNLGVEKDDCLYVGDSKSKDIAMAHQCGVDFLWYKTGADHLVNRADEYNLLKEVTHWPEAAVKAEKDAIATVVQGTVNISPNQIILEFNELLTHF